MARFMRTGSAGGFAFGLGASSMSCISPCGFGLFLLLGGLPLLRRLLLCWHLLLCWRLLLPGRLLLSDFLRIYVYYLDRHFYYYPFFFLNIPLPYLPRWLAFEG